MTPPMCGLWPGRQGLVAVVVDEDGRSEPPIIAPATDDDDCWNFLSLLDATVGLDYELVLPSHLARLSSIPRLALERGVHVWLVPDHLVEAVRIIAGLNKGPPRRTAAALARVPLAPTLRRALRHLSPPDRRQLALL